MVKGEYVSIILLHKYSTYCGLTIGSVVSFQMVLYFILKCYLGCVCVCVCFTFICVTMFDVYVRMHTVAHIWRSEDNFWGLHFSSHCEFWQYHLGHGVYGTRILGDCIFSFCHGFCQSEQAIRSTEHMLLPAGPSRRHLFLNVIYKWLLYLYNLITLFNCTRTFWISHGTPCEIKLSLSQQLSLPGVWFLSRPH